MKMIQKKVDNFYVSDKGKTDDNQNGKIDSAERWKCLW
jgi:hypothetical protein